MASGYIFETEDTTALFVTENSAFFFVTEDWVEDATGPVGGFGAPQRRGRKREHHNVFIDLSPLPNPSATPAVDPSAIPEHLDGATPDPLEAASPEPVPEQVRVRGPSAIAIYQEAEKRGRIAEHNRRAALLLRRRW